MLEARAHHELKALLRHEGGHRWPHHLSLSRLVARSLRRGDQTLVRLAAGSDPSWLIGLLVPLALSEAPLALVVTDALRQRLLQVELPRLQAAGQGLALPCFEGDEPGSARVWLLNHQQLLRAWQLPHRSLQAQARRPGHEHHAPRAVIQRSHLRPLLRLLPLLLQACAAGV